MRTLPSLWFIGLILITALFMELVGSVVSVIGLSALFASDPIIIVMAIILDVAKVTSVSFVYQYRSEISRAMKYYFTAAVLVLMIITSAGAFGYLSKAFQKATQPSQEISMKLEGSSKERDELVVEKKELTEQKTSMNKQIAAIPTENEEARRRLISSFRAEQDRVSKRLEVVNKRLDFLNSDVTQTKREATGLNVDAGPIVYISKAFGLSIEDASKYIILIIVLVFDPLAVMLILAANFLIKKRRDAPTPTEWLAAQKPVFTPEQREVLNTPQDGPEVQGDIRHDEARPKLCKHGNWPLECLTCLEEREEPIPVEETPDLSPKVATDELPVTLHNHGTVVK